MSEPSYLPCLIHSDGREIVLTGQLTIGRLSESSLQKDDRVSRQHARVEVIGQQVMLSDLDSHNGTWVNDQKITAPVELHDGDRIRIGRTTFVFKAAIAPSPGESAQSPVIPGEDGKTMNRTTNWLTTEPITLVRGSDGAEFGLNRNMRIGRDETNDLVLKENTSASQFHATIELLEGQVVISDLNSRNGAWVNGKRITTPTFLKHGDKIRLGDTVFRLRVGDRSLPSLDVTVQPAGARKMGWGLIAGISLVGCIAVTLVLAATGLIGSGLLSASSKDNSNLEATQQVARQEALRAVVMVFVPAYEEDIRNWDTETGSAGSGSILNEKGIVLTNFHVIGNNETGKYYNPDGFILIGLNWSNPQAKPDSYYRCEIVKEDLYLDLAILRVVELFNSDTGALAPLPGDLSFTPIPIGDSDELSTGDPMTIIGFPGVGGYTPTLTTGVVSGFLADEGLIKTDAELSAGNSGGMAINQKGELIGVPTLKTTGTDYLGYIRPISLAGDIINSACPECLP